jgi:phage host-nuclease inhibitor protein Gam
MPPTDAPAAADPTEETKSGWSISNLKSYLKSKTGLSNDVAALQAEVTVLKCKLDDRDAFISAQEAHYAAQLAQLQMENAAQRADLEAVADYAQTHGLMDTPAAKSPAGKAAGQAIAAQVSAQLSQLGVPVENLPSATAATPGATDEALTALIDDMKAEKDPVKKGKLAASVTALREQLTKRAAN